MVSKWSGWAGAFVGFFLVGLLSGFWAEPQREMRGIGALFWIALFAGGMGAFDIAYYHFRSGLYLFITGSFIVTWGLVFFAVTFILRLSGLLGGFMNWIYQEGESHKGGGRE
jgi:hypothetical protein